MRGRIVLDATYSVGKNLSGVGVYCRRILCGVAGAHPAERFAAAFRSQRVMQSGQFHLPGNVIRTLLWDGGVVARVRLFHGLNQRMPRFAVPRSCCTFHDLFVMTGEYSATEYRERFTQQAREAAARSGIVICVSQFTAGQVHDLLGVERSRLRVIHHGATPRNAPEVTREPWILSAGAIQKRKNILRLVEAFERASTPPWRLVLAGSKGFGAGEVMARVNASPARDRIDVTGYVDDPILDSLYAKASIFAFPSLDEGFGMPALDAMASGIPVLSSNRSALAEVCGDGALLVDPERVDEMENGLKRLIEDDGLRQALVTRGLARASQFSWERAAQLTWDVYRELL